MKLTRKKLRRLIIETLQDAIDQEEALDLNIGIAQDPARQQEAIDQVIADLQIKSKSDNPAYAAAAKKKADLLIKSVTLTPAQKIALEDISAK